MAIGLKPPFVSWVLRVSLSHWVVSFSSLYSFSICLSDGWTGGRTDGRTVIVIVVLLLTGCNKFEIHHSAYIKRRPFTIGRVVPSQPKQAEWSRKRKRKSQRRRKQQHPNIKLNGRQVNQNTSSKSEAMVTNGPKQWHHFWNKPSDTKTNKKRNNKEKRTIERQFFTDSNKSSLS